MTQQIRDCTFEKDILSKLEKLSADLDENFSDSSFNDIDLLNENTENLNEELSDFIGIQNEILRNKRITPSVKRNLSENFIPKESKKAFLQTDIVNVKDLFTFVAVNRTNFRGTNPTSQDEILKTLRKIDQNAFRGFDSDYPNLNKRFQRNKITSSEIRFFTQENGFDLNLFSERLKKNRRGIFNLLENFFSSMGIGAEIMGSFCLLVKNVYGPVKNQRNISDTPVEFSSNYQNVLGLINPSQSDVLDDLQELIQLVNSSQKNILDTSENMVSAIATIASAFGISLDFPSLLDKFLSNEHSSGKIDIDWNLENIRDAIAANDSRFSVIVPETEKPLGDINQDGVVDGNDSIQLQTYIDNSANSSVIEYTDQIFLPYLNKNAEDFSDFVDIPTASDSSSNIKNLLGNFSSDIANFGANEQSGDFGISSMLNALGLLNGLIPSVRILSEGSVPVDISSIIKQLNSVKELTDLSQKRLLLDFNEFSASYHEETRDSLQEAELNSVQNPSKTAEINEKNKIASEEKYTKALESVSMGSKTLGGAVSENIERIKDGINRLAAVGVLDKTAEQLFSVIDRSSETLRSKINMFSPKSLDNGFHYNMESSYGKMAGQIAFASNASKDETNESMKKAVRGMLTQSVEKYQLKNKEDVEFVALRFCKLASEIERSYKELSDPIEESTMNFQEINSKLMSTGSNVTLNAIKAGAIRYDTDTRLNAMREAGTIDSTLANPFINTQGQISTMPGQGVSSMLLAPPLPDDYEFPSFEEALRGKRGVRYIIGNSSRLNSPEWIGFTPKSVGGGVDTISMRLLYRLAASWGRPITVNSAYRSPIANGAARNKNGPDSSGFHVAGKAFDVQITGRSEQIRFLNLAYTLGFRGFGTYSNFVHIDTRGNPGDWGSFRYFSLRGPNGGKVG